MCYRKVVYTAIFQILITFYFSSAVAVTNDKMTSKQYHQPLIGHRAMVIKVRYVCFSLTQEYQRSNNQFYSYHKNPDY